MNELIATLVWILVIQFNYGQITTTKIPEKNVDVSTKTSDSLQNFLGEDVYKYIGQELYLKGKSKSRRKSGYSRFIIDYQYKGNNSSENIYKCCNDDNYNSKYSELEGSYFEVVAVHKHPKAEKNNHYAKIFYLELKEKESGDKVFFKYDSQHEVSFPFILVGFFEKQKQILVGEKFVFANKVLESSSDIETGKPINNIENQIWECVDLTIEEEYYLLSLIVKNSSGEKTTVPHIHVSKDFGQYCYTKKEAKIYEKKFGKSKWLKILEGKVAEGFTEEMVLLSWGEPKEINKASYGDQWVYENQYLYFENGKLESYN